jgi:hypothetical protein
VAVPILLVAMVLANRSSAQARLVWIGALAYTLYNFAFYVFGATFNDMFLVHVSRSLPRSSRCSSRQ